MRWGREELLQLPVKVRAFKTGLFGNPAHVALLPAEELFEIDAFERLARLAQRQVEKSRGDFRRHGMGGCRGLADADGGRRGSGRIPEPFFVTVGEAAERRAPGESGPRTLVCSRGG